MVVLTLISFTHGNISALAVFGLFYVTVQHMNSDKQ